MHKASFGEQLRSTEGRQTPSQPSELEVGQPQSLAHGDTVQDSYSINREDFERLLAQQARQHGGTLGSLRIMYNMAYSFKLLTKDEEINLGKRVEKVDSGAITEFVNANLRLSFYFGRRYTRWGVPLVDIVQEANIGLLRAVEKYDWRRGFRFSTYGAWWIKQAIERRIPVNATNATLSQVMFYRFSKCESAEGRLTFQLKRQPTDEEIANEVGLSVEQVQEAFRAGLVAKQLSINTPVYSDGGEDSVIIADRMAGDPEETHAIAERTIGMESLSIALAQLPEDQYRVVRKRFGLKGTASMSQAELARNLDITEGTLRNRERKILESLHGLLSQ